MLISAILAAADAGPTYLTLSLLPKPWGATDYLVAGTIGSLAALGVLFLLALRQMATAHVALEVPKASVPPANSPPDEVQTQRTSVSS